MVALYMTNIEVKIVGEFLRNYESDLEYLVCFRRYMRGEIPSKDYSIRGNGSFYNFLTEFRIIRNIVQGGTHQLLDLTKAWCEGPEADEVDAFAQHLSKADISRGAILSSLASKVLFLNNPQQLLPMDALARKALNVRLNSYSAYSTELKTYSQKRQESLTEIMIFLNPIVSSIERSLMSELPEIEKIRLNRLIDKMLWVQGQQDRYNTEGGGNVLPDKKNMI